jgi:hypothetical protein
VLRVDVDGRVVNPAVGGVVVWSDRAYLEHPDVSAMSTGELHWCVTDVKPRRSPLADLYNIQLPQAADGR